MDFMQVSRRHGRIMFNSSLPRHAERHGDYYAWTFSTSTSITSFAYIQCTPASSSCLPCMLGWAYPVSCLMSHSRYIPPRFALQLHIQTAVFASLQHRQCRALWLLSRPLRRLC